MSIFDDLGKGGIGGIGGFLLGGPIGGALGAMIGGGMDAADAQQKIAQQQLDQAGFNRYESTLHASPSQGEIDMLKKQLQLYNNVYSLNMSAINQQKKLADAINPAAASAGMQAYQLMQGGTSAATAPIMAQRNFQKQQLENKLKSQLGSGYATSTAGIQALNSFDMQSQQLQFGMMGSLMQMSQIQGPNYAQTANNMGANLGAMGSQYMAEAGNIKNRQINAITQNPITPYQGAQFIGDLGTAHAIQGAGQSVMSLAGSVMGAYAGGMGGGAARNPYSSTPAPGNYGMSDTYNPNSRVG